MTFGAKGGMTCDKCVAFVPDNMTAPTAHVCFPTNAMLRTPNPALQVTQPMDPPLIVSPKTVTAAELYEVQTALDLAVEERDRAVRERDLLRPVAYRPQAMLGVLVGGGRPSARELKPLHEALEAWSEDEGRKED